MLKIDIITLFPDIFFGPFDVSIVKRARENNLVEINAIDLRDYTQDVHRKVDDRPYGGGPGMVLQCEPIFKAVEDLRSEHSKIVMVSPQGMPFKQKNAQTLSETETHLIFLCGHYEGFDERIRQELVDYEFCIGDYVLSNGNLAAMVITDSIVRLLPGALGCAQSAHSESFSENLLEYPHYTRPENFRGLQVPNVLLSGHHAEIEKWRHEQSIERTQQRRPDLLQ